MAVETQLSVVLPNKPGTLGKVCGALFRANVNIRAITVNDTVEHCLVRLLVDDPRKALGVLKEYSPCEAQVLAVSLKNEAGVLAKLAEKLGSAGVNINYIYGSAEKKGETALLVLHVSDLKKALEAAVK